MKTIITTTLFLGCLTAYSKPLVIPQGFEGLRISYEQRSITKVSAVYIHSKSVKACNQMKAYSGGKNNWSSCYNGMYSFFYKQEASK